MRFAAGFVLKPEHQTCNMRGLPKPKVQYFSSGSTILGCDVSGQKWAFGALEIGKVAVAAVRVPFLPVRHRKSGCGCSAVRFLGPDPGRYGAQIGPNLGPDSIRFGAGFRARIWDPFWERILAGIVGIP